MKLLALVSSTRTQRALTGLLGEPSHQIHYVRRARTAIRAVANNKQTAPNMVIIDDQACDAGTDPLLGEFIRQCRRLAIPTLFVNRQPRQRPADNPISSQRIDWQNYLLNQNPQGKWIIEQPEQGWLAPLPILSQQDQQHDSANDESIRGIRIIFEG
ncbi:hypothetical protein [Parvibium lacunae]|uniref:Uncharacterized protein n=1 Tax=Parvibium lacunae TaxID=1888893 RepID=A0A368L6S9_9BURK|nr:hypothetical protein [Parvibium lacunae]RCS59327.1 hypothetical protein DU000_00880 [Parvibium lacunae]